jgi:zinc protease
MKRKSVVFALIVAVAAMSMVGDAQQRAAATPIDIPKLSFEKFTLPNGLEVILSEDHRLPLTAVNLWYHVGPANEEPGRTGFAHLFEHMMFQGSKYVPSDSHFRLLEAVGATGINGTTDFDRTNYFETVPASELELALWIESDRMGYLLDRLDQTSLSNQQDVVRNERRQSTENRPYGIVEEGLYHLLFPKTHPYYAAVIGSHADIQAAKLENVRSFFKLYYAPNNASLAIVGDIIPAATRKLVEHYFGSLRRGQPVPKISVETPPVTAERRAVLSDRVELQRVYMGWITSPIFKEGDADAAVAAIILGGGRASRLYKTLVYDKQIAQDVSAQQESLMLGSVFEIRVTARPGHSAGEIEKALDLELARFREAGPGASEVESARNIIETRNIQRLETFGGFGGVADRLNRYNHYLGTPDYITQDVDRYRKVTRDSVKAFAQQQLRPNARAVVHGVPGQPDLGPQVPPPPQTSSALGRGAESVNADEPWRTEQPMPVASRALQVPVPTSFRLPNGLTVIVNERPALPVVAASVVLKTGSDANPSDKPGLASFTTAMLDEGTTTRTALQIADEVARLGGTLSTGSSADSMQVTMDSLKRTFPAMLELAADVVRRASFPAEEIERQRASRLAGLVQQRESPNATADAAMLAALYGHGHAYGFTELGTETSNRAMSRDDLQKFWAQNFVPNNAALIVSGQLTTAELEPLVEKAFGDWKPGTLAERSLGTPVTTTSRLVFVDKPGAPQTQLRVASIGAPRSTPDYEPVLVMNTALGGLFSSRINMNLREEHGYTYGARSQFGFRRSAGPFQISSGIRTDVTAPAVAEIFKEVDRMRATPLSSNELSVAKDYLVRSLPAQFETAGRVTASTANLFIYDLGLDYYAKYPARLTAVTADQAKAAAQKYVVPEKLLIVVVGDQSKIKPELDKLMLGPAEVRTADGTVVAPAAVR